MLNKTKAALQSCQCHYQMFKQEQNTRISAGGQSLSRMHICILGIVSVSFSKALKSAPGFSSNRGKVPQTNKRPFWRKPYLRQWRTLGRTAKNYPNMRWYQSFGSIPRCCSFSRQASLTHELNWPVPAAALICSNKSSSNRMCFIVLPERSKFFFVLDGCIGSYRWCKVKLNGNYHFNVKQLKTAKPAGATNTNGPLTTNR